MDNIQNILESLRRVRKFPINSSPMAEREQRRVKVSLQGQLIAARKKRVHSHNKRLVAELCGKNISRKRPTGIVNLVVVYNKLRSCMPITSGVQK